MSEKRILVLRQNLALRNCRTAVHFLLPLFQKIYNQLFHKRLRAGVLPLTPYNTAKSKNDGLSGKNFSGGSVFPDNKAFRKLRFAHCLKKWQPFQLQCLIRNFWKFAKNGRKKAANLFRIYCFLCRCGAAGYSVVNNKRGGALWATPLQWKIAILLLQLHHISIFMPDLQSSKIPGLTGFPQFHEGSR